MSKIQIEGLTRKQIALAEVLWQYATLDEVNAFINTLQSPSREEAMTIVELMRLAVLDQAEAESTAEFDALMERIKC